MNIKKHNQHRHSSESWNLVPEFVACQNGRNSSLGWNDIREFDVIATNNDPDRDDDTERGVATKTRPKTKKPSQYKVLLLNDDYTPMEFVVSILMGVFKRSQEEATKIMLAVHQKGVGVCGIYTFEVAETKVGQVMDAAKRGQHPLKCTLEKA